MTTPVIPFTVTHSGTLVHTANQPDAAIWRIDHGDNLVAKVYVWMDGTTRFMFEADYISEAHQAQARRAFNKHQHTLDGDVLCGTCGGEGDCDDCGDWVNPGAHDDYERFQAVIKQAESTPVEVASTPDIDEALDNDPVLLRVQLTDADTEITRLYDELAKAREQIQQLTDSPEALKKQNTYLIGKSAPQIVLEPVVDVLNGRKVREYRWSVEALSWHALAHGYENTEAEARATAQRYIEVL